jgi:hypothetical protein
MENISRNIIPVFGLMLELADFPSSFYSRYKKISPSEQKMNNQSQCSTQRL